MSRPELFILALLGLTVLLGVAAFQTSPGYMDADYYYAGGLQIAAGKGFTEPYLWNYLDDPAALPHPSHAYWMPLASLLAAALPVFTGSSSWLAARLPFLLAAAILPPLTASLAYTLTRRRPAAWGAGLLAVFSGFYLPFLTTTDTFAIYMLLGGLFFWIIQRRAPTRRAALVQAFLLGLLAGGMHLARADGLLWLVVALALPFLFQPAWRERHPWLLAAGCALVSLSGYLMVMTPWFLRNLAVLGSLLSPAGSRMLWLTSYDQLFSYPAASLTVENWLSVGLKEILKARLWALGLNFSTALAVQGGIFLLSFTSIGFWHLRREKSVKTAGFAWLLTLAVMTIVFPFAGARGGFFHSGAATQVVWWALAPVGLDRLIRLGNEKRGWNLARARRVFQPGLIFLTALFTLTVLFLRLPGWDREHHAYQALHRYLESQGTRASDVIVVSNPPGYYLASGSPAIAIPDGDANTVLSLADRYGAAYLILEPGSVPAGLMPLYERPDNMPGLVYLGRVEEAEVYALAP